MKTQLEQAMECVVNIFHQYCILKPMDDFLQKGEFTKLMKEQAQPFIKNTLPTGVDEKTFLEQLFNKADKDKNGALKFNEFCYVLGCALEEAHHRSHDLEDDSKKSGGHGHGHSH